MAESNTSLWGGMMKSPKWFLECFKTRFPDKVCKNDWKRKKNAIEIFQEFSLTAKLVTTQKIGLHIILFLQQHGNPTQTCLFTTFLLPDSPRWTLSCWQIYKIHKSLFRPVYFPNRSSMCFNIDRNSKYYGNNVHL